MKRKQAITKKAKAPAFQAYKYNSKFLKDITKLPAKPPRMISDKEKEHGYWPNTAETAQQLKQVMHQSYNWRNGNLSFSRREAIEMICTKLARIGSGDTNLRDHWEDGGNYFWLGGEEWKTK